MEQLMVISAVGGEPTAVVQELTRVIMDCGGNIKESRISSFGSDVAMLLLVSGNWHTVSRMERELTRFANNNGVTMQFKRTEPRKFGKDLVSNGMVLAADAGEGVRLLTVDGELAPGAKVR